MDGIKAFVGHSFASGDKEVVNKFLDHFRTLSRAYPGFTWDHAEEADLKTLSEKVLSKIEGKNVFIGICTGRELAVEKGSLSRSILSPKLRAPQQDFKWKASDWIIQEIGLAIGRKMKLVIFLEEGVREPGGLYGSLEYITFSRSHPNDSFDKLLQMLSTLSPLEASTLQTETKPLDPEKKQKEVSLPGDREPKPTWSQEDYDNAAFHVIWEDDEKALDNINQTYEESPLATEQAIAVWRADQEYLRIFLRKKPNFDRLKVIAADNQTNGDVLYYLASGYSTYEDHLEAAKTFEKAAEYSKDIRDKIRDLGEAAIERARAGEKERAAELLEQVKTEIGGDPKFTENITYLNERLAQTEKEDDFLAAVMEYRLELKPDDNRSRFDLAYKHSEMENKDVALQHYLKIPRENRYAITWNNLGVSFGEFGMSGRSVSAFRRSEELGETLAMSNMGFKFLSAGFVDEAQQLCDRALAVKDYHKNIPQLLTRIREVPDEEAKKLDEALDKVKPKVLFYRKAGQATIFPSPKSLHPKWQSPECVLDAIIDGTTIKMNGSYETAASTLAGLLAGGFVKSPPIQHKVEYVGEMRGQAIFGAISRNRSEPQSALLELAGNNVKVLMYFSADQKEIHVMENARSQNPRFYVLTPVP